jgi:hypothetical protein
LWDTHLVHTEAARKLAKEVVQRPAPGQSTLWHEMVKLDTAVQLVDRWVRTFPELTKEKDADRRRAYDVVSSRMLPSF